jgi:hypothetical protein
MIQIKSAWVFAGVDARMLHQVIEIANAIPLSVRCSIIAHRPSLDVKLGAGASY